MDKIQVGEEVLFGELNIPHQALGVVLFAQGSGSSRLSPRNQFVARYLEKRGIGTLLFDLLTEEEEQSDALTAFSPNSLHNQTSSLLAPSTSSGLEALAKRISSQP